MFTPQIGHFNDLLILRDSEVGLILDGGEDLGNILLPKRYIPETYEIGERIKIFLYLDSDDRPIATTCLLYTSPSPRDATLSRMPSSA